MKRSPAAADFRERSSEGVGAPLLLLVALSSAISWKGATASLRVRSTDDSPEGSPAQEADRLPHRLWLARPTSNSTRVPSMTGRLVRHDPPATGCPHLATDR